MAKKKTDASVWLNVPVTWQIVNELRGGTPKNPKLAEEHAEKRRDEKGLLSPESERAARIEGFLDMKQPGPRGKAELERVSAMKGGDGQLPSVAAMADAVAADWPIEEIDRMSCGFLRDDRGIYVRGAQIRAHFKEAAIALAPWMEQQYELRNYRANLIRRFYVKQDKVWLFSPDGSRVITQPDGSSEHPLHVMTAMGPRQCLKRVDYVLRPRLGFTIRILNDGYVHPAMLEALLTYGCTQGAFHDRTLGYGRYAWSFQWDGDTHSGEPEGVDAADVPPDDCPCGCEGDPATHANVELGKDVLKQQGLPV